MTGGTLSLHRIRMDESGQRHCGLAQSHGGPRDKSCVDDQDSAVARSTDDLPARIRLDGVRADRPGENEVRISLRDVLERYLTGGPMNVTIRVSRAGDVDELVHETAAAHRDQW